MTNFAIEKSGGTFGDNVKEIAFQYWVAEQSIARVRNRLIEDGYVSNISAATLYTWKGEYKWEHRKKTLQKSIQTRANIDIVQRSMEHMDTYRKLAEIGTEFIQTKGYMQCDQCHNQIDTCPHCGTNLLPKPLVKNIRDALSLIKVGIGGERDVLGTNKTDPDKVAQVIQLEILKRMGDALDSAVNDEIVSKSDAAKIIRFFVQNIANNPIDITGLV